VGGDELDEAIIQHVKKEYSVALGERTSEAIKIAIGSAFPLHEEEKAEIRGRDLATGLPKVVQVTSEEIREAISDPVTQIVQAAVGALAETPPELSQDILNRGIALTGGGGMLRGLSMRIAEECDVSVHLTDRPLECVVLGAGKCLEALDSLRDLFITSSTR
jgi:rod shape-determining protein MreB